jgi:DNA-binding IscR family transcriptional regulator
MDDSWSSGDLDVDAFVDVNLSSFAAWDIVVYLEHNEGVSAGVADLVGRLGRREHEVEQVLHDLVDCGVVVASAGPDGVVRYSMSPDPGVRHAIARFVDLAKVRGIRLEFVRRVLGHMSRG